MLWFHLSLLTAITVGARDVLVKYLAPQLGASRIMGLELFWAIPLMAAALVFIEVPELDITFWWVFLISIPINGMAYYYYVSTIARYPLSLTLPFLAFTPVFMVVSGVVVLEEHVSTAGLTGIFLIVAGSYLLNVKQSRLGIWRPFLAIVENPGSRRMLFVAFIFSLAAVLGKKAMLHSSPLFFGFFFFLVFNILFVCLLLVSRRCTWGDLIGHPRQGSLLGGLLLFHIGFHSLAIILSTAAYMIAIKRTSILFAILLGWFLFREEEILSRALAALLMVGGAVVLSLWG